MLQFVERDKNWHLIEMLHDNTIEVLQEKNCIEATIITKKKHRKIQPNQ